MVSVSSIYSSGEKIQSYPYRMYILESGTDSPGDVIVSVPKKIFKRAVKRNLLRRRTKEAFRHMKGDFPSLSGKHILLVYISSQVLDYGSIVEGLRNTLEKI